jgi:hypothetical protein
MTPEQRVRHHRVPVVFVGIFACLATYQVYRHGLKDWLGWFWLANGVYFTVGAIWGWRSKEWEPEPGPQPSAPPRTVSNRQVLGLMAVVTAVVAVLALISSLRGEPKPGPTNMCYVRTSDSSLTTRPGIPWCPADVTVPN